MARTSLMVRVFRNHRRIFTVLGALVAFFLLMDYVVMPVYVNHGSRLTVPTVVGLSIGEATALLDSVSLEAVKAEVRPDARRPEGTVVYQNPLPGSVVKEGRRIYLTISGGEEMVNVPLLRGKSLRDARFALERFGLKIGGVSYDFSDIFPVNTIIDQTYAADASVALGTRVGVTVSRGRATDDIAVPALIGKTLAEAKKILEDAGLKVGIVTYQPSFELLPNTVVDQFPRPAEQAKFGQEIDLFVVKVGKPSDEIIPPKE
jgi:beta-lactam-binding protein with PASTA domain